MSEEVVFGRDEAMSDLLGAACRHGAVLLGPPGSGLSTVLRLVAAQLRDSGQQVRQLRFPDSRFGSTAKDHDLGTLLVVDDAHLGSEPQLLALRDRSLVGPILLGARSGAVPSQLSWLWRSGALATVRLDPLDDVLIRRIIEDRAGAPVHRATLEGIVHRSGGRPAFAVDEITSLLADDRLVLQAGFLRGRLTGQVGTHLIERARELLDDLPVTLATMIETIAIAGSLPVEALVPLAVDLPTLRRRSLVEPADLGGGAGIRLCPPALTGAVRASVAPARTTELAHQVLQATRSMSLTSADRARLHKVVGDTVQLDELAAAAWTALRTDDRTELSNLAGEIGERGQPGLAIKAELAAELGARTDAAKWYADLMLDPAASDELRGRAAMEYSLIQMWDLDRPDEAVATARALAAQVRGSAVGPAAQVHLAALTLYAGRPHEATAIAMEVDLETLDKPARAGRTLVETISRALCDPEHAEPDTSRWILDRDEEGTFERGVAAATIELSFELIGRYRDAAAVVDDAKFDRSRGDTPTSAAWWSLARARSELAIGRHRSAHRAAIEAAADFADVNHPSGVRWATGTSLLASAISGDRAATRAALAAFEALDAGVPFLDVDLRRAEAWAAWSLGNSMAAGTLLDDAARLAVESGAVTLEAVTLHDSFRLLRTSVCDRLASLAVRFPVPSITLRARHVVAVAAGDPSDLLVVASDLEQAGAWLLAAEAAGDAARLATSQGLRATARTAVGHRARLADLCGNPMTPGLADYVPTTLTRRERDVATLAADGRSSREIAGELAVSARTVDNLLHRVYVKLGVHSRTELNTWLTAQSSDRPG